MLDLFMKSGGFGVFVDGRRGARSLVTVAAKARDDLSYVYRIVLTLCRLEKYVDDAGKRSLKYAISFVQKDDDTYTVRNITDIWETKKRAAPHIFAFYPVLAEIFQPGNSATSVGTRNAFTEVVRALAELASDRQHVAKFASIAAYSADILDKHARDIRLKDFRDIKRVEPTLDNFSIEERELLEAIDPDRLTEKALGV